MTCVYDNNSYTVNRYCLVYNLHKTIIGFPPYPLMDNFDEASYGLS